MTSYRWGGRGNLSLISIHEQESTYKVQLQFYATSVLTFHIRKKNIEGKVGEVRKICTETLLI